MHKLRKFAVQDPTLALMIVWTIGFVTDFITGPDLALRGNRCCWCRNWCWQVSGGEC